MPPIQCPRCGHAATFAAGVTPVCPACAYPGADTRMTWTPVAPAAPGHSVTAIVLGAIGAVVLVTVVMAAVVFLLVSNVSEQVEGGPGMFQVVSAGLVDASQCGNQTATCHRVVVLLDNRNGTYDVTLHCCWSALDGQGGGYDGDLAPGSPDFVAQGAAREVTILFAVGDPSVRLESVWYDRGYGAGESQPLPAY